MFPYKDSEWISPEAAARAENYSSVRSAKTHCRGWLKLWRWRWADISSPVTPSIPLSFVASLVPLANLISACARPPRLSPLDPQCAQRGPAVKPQTGDAILFWSLDTNGTCAAARRPAPTPEDWRLRALLPPAGCMRAGSAGFLCCHCDRADCR